MCKKIENIFPIDQNPAASLLRSLFRKSDDFPISHNRKVGDF